MNGHISGHTSDLAFREAFRRYFKNLCLIAMGVVRDGDDANVIVSQAFMDLRERGTDFAAGNIGRLLYIAVRNDCIDFLRKRKRDKQKFIRYLVESVVIDEDPLMTVAVVDEIVWDEIWSGMCTLTPRQRGILINHFLRNIPAKDLAGQLGIGLSTFYTTRNRGIRGLCEFLGVGCKKNLVEE